MLKEVAQRQLAWLFGDKYKNADVFLAFAMDLQKEIQFGSQHTVEIDLRGSLDAITITGEISSVSREYEELKNKEFMSIRITATFHDEKNLELNMLSDLVDGKITVTIKGGDSKSAENLVSLIKSYFPRISGPTESDVDLQASYLSSLTKSAREAIQEGERLLNLTASVENAGTFAEKNREKIKEILIEIEEINKSVKSVNDQAQSTFESIAENATRVKSLKDEVKSYQQQSKGASDEVGAIESKIREFFNSIDNYSKSIDEAHQLAKTTVEISKNEIGTIIDENRDLQDQIKEHLLKAVGASLFSAFESRKNRISKSKWVWAGLTAAAITAQVIIFIWVAKSAPEIIDKLDSATSYFLSPSFLLRITASIPIIFFIGYAIHQYAREREFEELYGFKSVLSYSLSPYLDLVNDIENTPESSDYRNFVVKTIGQIFENPISEKTEAAKLSKKDVSLPKSILEMLIDKIEK